MKLVFEVKTEPVTQATIIIAIVTVSSPAGSQSTQYVTAILAKTKSNLTNSAYLKKEQTQTSTTGKKREYTHLIHLQ